MPGDLILHLGELLSGLAKRKRLRRAREAEPLATASRSLTDLDRQPAEGKIPRDEYDVARRRIADQLARE